jgi:uncharacterized Zn finger protein
METLLFSFQGTAAEPYEVTFVRDGIKLSAYCTCPAGNNGQYCKHRFSILAGQAAGVVSSNSTQVSIVTSWLPGSSLAMAMDALAAAEGDLKRAQQALSIAKKRVAAAMR